MNSRTTEPFRLRKIMKKLVFTLMVLVITALEQSLATDLTQIIESEKLDKPDSCLSNSSSASHMRIIDGCSSILQLNGLVARLCEISYKNEQV